MIPCDDAPKSPVTLVIVLIVAVASAEQKRRIPRQDVISAHGNEMKDQWIRDSFESEASRPSRSQEIRSSCSRLVASWLVLLGRPSCPAVGRHATPCTVNLPPVSSVTGTIVTQKASCCSRWSSRALGSMVVLTIIGLVPEISV